MKFRDQAIKLLDKEGHLYFWVAVDVCLYALSMLLNSRTSVYENFILGSLDVFLLLAKDKVRIFHSLPKLFLLHVDNNVCMQLLAVGLYVLHVWQHRRLANSIMFFTSVTLAVLFSSFGASKVLSAGLATGVMAAYAYNWESAEVVSQKEEEEDDNDSKTEDAMLHDHAIA